MLSVYPTSHPENVNQLIGPYQTPRPLSKVFCPLSMSHACVACLCRMLVPRACVACLCRVLMSVMGGRVVFGSMLRSVIDVVYIITCVCNHWALNLSCNLELVSRYVVVVWLLCGCCVALGLGLLFSAGTMIYTISTSVSNHMTHIHHSHFLLGNRTIKTVQLHSYVSITLMCVWSFSLLVCIRAYVCRHILPEILGNDSSTKDVSIIMLETCGFVVIEICFSFTYVHTCKPDWWIWLAWFGGPICDQHYSWRAR